jgi:hypothetical protein
MANIFGIATQVTLPVSYGTVAGADVTLTSSTEVTVITTGVLVSTFQGDYFPLIFGVFTVVLGATAPSAFVIAFKLGAGSDVATWTVEPALLVNAAELVIPFFFVGANSASAWFPTGSTINITAKGTGQASTAKFVGSKALVALVEGPNI